MTQKETGAADVTLDLLAIQSKAVEAIRDYSRYLRNAENAGLPDWIRRRAAAGSAQKPEKATSRRPRPPGAPGGRGRRLPSLRA